MNKYITATILAAISSGVAHSQDVVSVPRLVVNITIDQLRTDYIEAFMPFYRENGFKKLMKNGMVYHNAQYTFSPIDRASSIASVATGTTPANNGITGYSWLDKNTLIPVKCIDDNNYEGVFTYEHTSPQNITSTTINDELKVSTNGEALVYSIAFDRDAAVIAGGHAADAALWFNADGKRWCSSTYYFKNAPNWLKTYNLQHTAKVDKDDSNVDVTSLALECINSTGMGLDGVTDMLSVTYTAQASAKDNKQSQQQQQAKYIQLDRELGKLISRIESKFGSKGVLFVITGTGCQEDDDVDYAKYRIPSGTFYINRTANLLNMYLSAIYGQDKYVESCFFNQIFLNLNKIEQKRISMSDLLSRAQSFLVQNAGVRNAFTKKDLLLANGEKGSKLGNWFNPERCGDLIVELFPGWKLLNEDNQQQYTSKESYIPFPVIFYGANVAAETVSTPVTIDRIAPTIAKVIRIRAPNACASAPLYLGDKSIK